MPLRLTFNPGDDRHPSVGGGGVVFSRLDADLSERERCLAFLPVGGGRLERMVCPPPQRTAADTFVDAWVEPVVSPDGARIAYAWQLSAQASVFTWDRLLVVAPLSDPAEPQLVWRIAFRLPDGRFANHLAKPSWVDGETLRFLAAYDFVFKVKGGGANRLTDTAVVALALVDLSLESGQVAVVPGGDSVLAYASAGEGAVWIVRSDDSTALRRLDPEAAASTVVASFSAPVRDLANVGGVPVAVVGDGQSLEYVDPAGGARRNLRSVAGPIRRITALPGSRRFVAEVEAFLDPFGQPANLWLLELPRP